VRRKGEGGGQRWLEQMEVPGKRILEDQGQLVDIVMQNLETLYEWMRR